MPPYITALRAGKAFLAPTPTHTHPSASRQKTPQRPDEHLALIPPQIEEKEHQRTHRAIYTCHQQKIRPTRNRPEPHHTEHTASPCASTQDASAVNTPPLELARCTSASRCQAPKVGTESRNSSCTLGRSRSAGHFSTQSPQPTQAASSTCGIRKPSSLHTIAMASCPHTFAHSEQPVQSGGATM